MNSSVRSRALDVAFVTGATGLLGNNLVRLLISRGVTVRALARSVDKARRQFGDLPVEIVQGDLDDVSTFASALAGVDVVFHAAAFFRDNYKGGSHWDDLHRTNVVGTANLLNAAYAAGVRRFVHTSSIAVLHGHAGAAIDETMLRRVEDADDYYRSKILADREVEQFLLAHPDFWAAMVLPGWMHGPGDMGPTSAGQTVLDFMTGKIPGIVPGTFSLVDARDVAETQWAVLERGRRGERYLSAGRNMSMQDLAQTLEHVTGVKAPTRRIPFPMLYFMGALSEVWARITRQPVLVSLATVRLMARESGRTTFDHSKRERELGLRFRPVHQTLRDEVAWYRDNGWVPANIPARDTWSKRKCKCVDRAGRRAA
jgi:nucleoside-diphosphate-sugar epimerase